MYDVAKGTDINMLKNDVARLEKEGYKPQGGVDSVLKGNGLVYNQAMVKVKEIKTKPAKKR